MADTARPPRKFPAGRNSRLALRAFWPNIRKPNGPKREPGQTGRRPAVLLAYSGTGKRKYLAVLLESGDCDVTSCNDGKDALECLETGSFDLVVTGIVMPSLDGLELVRALRRRPAAPPVIAIADRRDKMGQIYLKNATLFGAVATHTLCETGEQLLKTMDWILRGRDVRTNVVW